MTKEEVVVGVGMGKGVDDEVGAAAEGVLVEARVVERVGMSVALQVGAAEEKPPGELKREAMSSSGRTALVVATPLEIASVPPLPHHSPLPAAEPKGVAEKGGLDAKPEHREVGDSGVRSDTGVGSVLTLPPPPPSSPPSTTTAPPTLHVLFSSPLAGYSRDGKCHPLEVLDYSAERETLIQVH